MVTKTFVDKDGIKSAERVTEAPVAAAPATTANDNRSAVHTQQNAQAAGAASNSQRSMQAQSQPQPQTQTQPQPHNPSQYYNYYGGGQPQAQQQQPPPPQQQYDYSGYPGYSNNAYNPNNGSVNGTNTNANVNAAAATTAPHYSYQNQNNNAHAQPHSLPRLYASAPPVVQTNQSVPPPVSSPSPTSNKTTASGAAAMQNNTQTQTPNIKKPVLSPRPTDVIHGKSLSSSHPGNEYYRAILKKYYKRYTSSPLAEKHKFAMLICHEISIRKPQGGRFLRYSESHAAWEEMVQKEAVEYILHVLNDCEIREKKRKDMLDREGTAANARKQKKLKMRQSSQVVTIDGDARVETPAGASETAKAPSNVNTNETAETTTDSQQSSSSSTPFQSRHCDKCLGTGLLPVPEALLPFTNTSSSDVPLVSLPIGLQMAPMPLHVMNPMLYPHAAAAAASAMDLTQDKTKDAEKNGTTDDIDNLAATATENGHGTAWALHLQQTEQKWGIRNDAKLTYPERIRQIEQKAQMQSQVLEQSQNHVHLLEDENIIKILEQAEKKWGVEVPDGFNLAQRVELLEKTAFNFMARLQVWL